jgi:hypothetical protein
VGPKYSYCGLKKCPFSSILQIRIQAPFLFFEVSSEDILDDFIELTIQLKDFAGSFCT